MGNRGVIAFIGGEADYGPAPTLELGQPQPTKPRKLLGYSRDTPLFFYTHWHGACLEDAAKLGIQRAHDMGRLDEGGLFARYVWEALVSFDKDNDGLNFRMSADSSGVNDHDVDPIVIDAASKTVFKVIFSEKDDPLDGILCALPFANKGHDRRRLKKLFTFDEVISPKASG